MVRKKPNYQQGKIFLITEEHKKKYCGNSNQIIYRSGWERDFCKYLLNNKCVTKLVMEEVIINYISPIDGNKHRYFMDFYFEITDKNGEIKRVLCEVKPFAQTQPPTKSLTKTGRKSKKRESTYQKQIRTYMVNMAKWEATKRFAEKNDLIFLILTDHPDANFRYETKFKLWTTEELGLNL